MATRNVIMGTVLQSRGSYTEGDTTTVWYYDNILEYKGSSFRCITTNDAGITGAPATYNATAHTLTPNTGWEFFVNTTGALDVEDRLENAESNIDDLALKVGIPVTIQKTGSVGAWVDVITKRGVRYKITNVSDESQGFSLQGRVSVWFTSSEDMSQIVDGNRACADLPIGSSVYFTPTQDGTKARIGSVQGSGVLVSKLEIEDGSSIDAKLNLVYPITYTDNSIAGSKTEIGNISIGGVNHSINMPKIVTDLATNNDVHPASASAVKKLKDLIDEGWIYKGIATPTTMPMVANAKIFYVAYQQGSYKNFPIGGGSSGNIVVNNCEIAFIRSYGGNIWVKDTIKEIKSIEKLDFVSAKYGAYKLDGTYSVERNMSGSPLYTLEFDVDGVSKCDFLSTIIPTDYSAVTFDANGAKTYLNLRTNPPSRLSVDVPYGSQKMFLSFNANANINFADAIDVVGYRFIPTENDNDNVSLKFGNFNHKLSDLPTISADDIPTKSECEDTALYNDILTKYRTLVDNVYVTEVDMESMYEHIADRPSYLPSEHIKCFKFSPTRARFANANQVVSQNDSFNRIKVLLTTTHNDERMGIHAVYQLMKFICNNWKDNCDLELLRSMVDFYVVPVQCPQNFENRWRTNNDYINPNRNYPTALWHNTVKYTADHTDSSKANWGGDAPLQMYETAVMANFVESIKPDISIDVHTSMDSGVGNMGMIEVDDYRSDLANVASIICRTCANNLAKEYTDYPSFVDDKFLYMVERCENGRNLSDPTNANSNPNYIGQYFTFACERGVDSILIETSPTIYWKNGTRQNTRQDGVQGVLTPSAESFRINVQFILNCVTRLVENRVRK